MRSASCTALRPRRRSAAAFVVTMRPTFILFDDAFAERVNDCPPVFFALAQGDLDLTCEGDVAHGDDGAEVVAMLIDERPPASQEPPGLSAFGRDDHLDITDFFAVKCAVKRYLFRF